MIHVYCAWGAHRTWGLSPNGDHMIDTATSLHLANRLGFGPAPGEIEHIRAAGFDGYLEEQLNPKPQQLPQALEAQLRSIPSFGKTTFQLYRDNWWRLDKVSANGSRFPKEDFSLLKMITNEVPPQSRAVRLARAVASPWRLHEALADFWFNHFNIYDRKQLCRIWTGAYEEEAIRPNMLGKFSDLLLATARHPAMLVYLDNAQNVAPRATTGHRKANGINENYAREVMELHTLGVDGGYTQADVVALAHMLTGWAIGVEDGSNADANSDGRLIRGGFRFVPRLHDATPQTLLGRKFPNADERDGEAALLMLARHPSTARHVSLRLAQYFVADQPPRS